MRSATLALLSTALTSMVGAWTTPVGNPTGNPIAKPSLGEIVPVGTPYEITWNPTSTGTVTLLLLRGPSENVVPLYAIAEKIDNSGKYSWTPSPDLEPDTLRYGIQLIQDANGAYQWSTQFGISGGSGSSSSSSSASGSATVSSSASASVTPSAGGNSTSYATVSSTATITNCSSVCPGHNSTATVPSSTSSASFKTTASLIPSPSSNVTSVYTPSPSATGPSSTVDATGGASATPSGSSLPVNNAGVKQLASAAVLTVSGLFAVASCLPRAACRSSNIALAVLIMRGNEA